MSLSLSTAGHGHLTVSLNDFPDSNRLLLVEHMIQVQGFKRIGTSLVGLDGKITKVFNAQNLALQQLEHLA